MTPQLRTRAISGVVLAALVVALTLWSFTGFAALCALGGGILLYEWWGLTKHRSRWWLLLGVVYLGAAIAGLLLLCYGNNLAVLALIAIVSAGDIAAYFIGSRYGRHKIAPSISPGKSWEGLAASVIVSALVSLSLAAQIVSVFSPLLQTVALIYGALLAVIGLAGDLFESSLKRHAGVKDSGRLIPGHGGLLDRVDALLPCAIFTSTLLLCYLWQAHGAIA